MSLFSNIPSKEAAPSATHAVYFRGHGFPPPAASLQVTRQPAVINAFYAGWQRRFCRSLYWEYLSCEAAMRFEKLTRVVFSCLSKLIAFNTEMLKNTKKKSFLIQSFKDNHTNILVFFAASYTIGITVYIQLVACFLI